MIINSIDEKSNIKIDLQIIDETIEDLKNNPNACMLYDSIISQDKRVIIRESDSGKVLEKFIRYFFENGFNDMQYVNNYKKIKDKNINSYSYEETITVLTKIFRGDRFISGLIYGCFKDGSLLKIIERLRSFIVTDGK